ncbi:MAG: hypothetical protein IKD28_04335 [Clostridia bacterium]|nr:hypothetical protein [Clostridia bacterium]
MDTIRVNSGGVKMVAHRGVSSLERENTTPAFVAAGNRSYYGVETDVHVTKDGKFVIIHNETTKEVSLGANCINVEENDYAAVADIILPDLDGSTIRQDIRIPLLCEYVHICKKYGKKCVLELKNHFQYDDIVKMIAEIEALDYLDGMIYISFDYENCTNLRKLLPNAEIQWLTGGDPRPMIDKLVEDKLDLDVHYMQLDKELIDLLHSKGITINCWTCDNAKDARNLIMWGVDYITSNCLE